MYLLYQCRKYSKRTRFNKKTKCLNSQNSCFFVYQLGVLTLDKFSWLVFLASQRLKYKNTHMHLGDASASALNVTFSQSHDLLASVKRLHLRSPLRQQQADLYLKAGS